MPFVCLLLYLTWIPWHHHRERLSPNADFSKAVSQKVISHPRSLVLSYWSGHLVRFCHPRSPTENKADFGTDSKCTLMSDIHPRQDPNLLQSCISPMAYKIRNFFNLVYHLWHTRSETSRILHDTVGIQDPKLLESYMTPLAYKNPKLLQSCIHTLGCIITHSITHFDHAFSTNCMVWSLTSTENTLFMIKLLKAKMAFL